MILELYQKTIPELEAYRDKWRDRLRGEIHPQERSRKYRRICRRIQATTNTINNKEIALEIQSNIYSPFDKA